MDIGKFTLCRIWSAVVYRPRGPVIVPMARYRSMYVFTSGRLDSSALVTSIAIAAVKITRTPSPSPLPGQENGFVSLARAVFQPRALFRGMPSGSSAIASASRRFCLRARGFFSSLRGTVPLTRWTELVARKGNRGCLVFLSLCLRDERLCLGIRTEFSVCFFSKYVLWD